VSPAASPSTLQDAEDIVNRFRALRRGMLRGSRREIARSGLTGAQLTVVSLLGNRGPMTLTELSRELELGHSTVSGIVDRLQAKGVVERQPHPTDRRYTRVSLNEHLSQRARAMVGGATSSRLVEVLAAAPEAERRTMRDGLALLQQYLTAAAAPPGAE